MRWNTILIKIHSYMQLIQCARIVAILESLLDTGDQALELGVVDTKRAHQHLLGKWRLGSEDSLGNERSTRVLAVEGGNGQGRLIANVQLEVDEATGEDKEVTSVQGLLKEGIGGANEAHKELSLDKEEDFSSTGVNVRGDKATFGSKIKTSNGEALSVKSREGECKCELHSRA